MEPQQGQAFRRSRTQHYAIQRASLLLEPSWGAFFGGGDAQGAAYSRRGPITIGWLGQLLRVGTWQVAPRRHHSPRCCEFRGCSAAPARAVLLGALFFLSPWPVAPPSQGGFDRGSRARQTSWGTPPSTPPSNFTSTPPPPQLPAPQHAAVWLDSTPAGPRGPWDEYYYSQGAAAHSLRSRALVVAERPPSGRGGPWIQVASWAP